LRLSNGSILQLKIFKSPYAAEQASKALAAQARKQFDNRSWMRELAASFSLSYAVPEIFQRTIGWRDEWVDHILHPTPDCIEAVTNVAKDAWTADKAKVAIVELIEVD
jgi:hypothetical protein